MLSFSLHQLYWVPDVSPELAPPLILVVQKVAVATGAEFKVHLKDIMPLILKSLMADGKEKNITKSVSITPVWSRGCFYLSFKCMNDAIH